MGFLDKVKEQAAAAQVMAKEAAQKGQAKLDEVQTKRSTDGTLRDLGAAYYAQQTGRGDGSDIERLISVLQAHEQANGPISLEATSPPEPAAAPVSGSVPTGSVPSGVPTGVPTGIPTSVPTAEPAAVPSAAPSPPPTAVPQPPPTGSTL